MIRDEKGTLLAVVSCESLLSRPGVSASVVERSSSCIRSITGNDVCPCKNAIGSGLRQFSRRPNPLGAISRVSSLVTAPSTSLMDLFLAVPDIESRAMFSASMYLTGDKVWTCLSGLWLLNASCLSATLLMFCGALMALGVRSPKTRRAGNLVGMLDVV